MKEKQPYEKPKMTFVENQPERRKSLKKEKSVNIKTEKQELQRLEEERVVIERKNRGIIKESIRYK